MTEKVLITGGAGFVGSHVCDELLAAGYYVRVLDNLSPQVHGPNASRPDYLSPDAELMVGDVRDKSAVMAALSGVSAIVHLASMVGVGQSMYEIARYVDSNDGGTATILQCLSERRVRKLVVASSMSIYGEGRYRTATGTVIDDAARTLGQMRSGDWNLRGPGGVPLEPIPTPEGKLPVLSSIYALTKFAQERMCLLVGQAYGISTVALRFFNIYGPRQALSNPYTGVLAIFASRLLNGNRPIIFEDGMQLRDFVHVRDVARACRQALEAPAECDGAYNVGSGNSITILEIAAQIAQVIGRSEIKPQLAGQYRFGDIRHCFADISLARERLGYSPQVRFQEGLDELAEWLSSQVSVDRVEKATDELSRRGLVA